MCFHYENLHRDKNYIITIRLQLFIDIWKKKEKNILQNSLVNGFSKTQISKAAVNVC